MRKSSPALNVCCTGNEYPLDAGSNCQPRKHQNYIAQDSSRAALDTVTTIFERIQRLVTFPHRGRQGREEGTRELALSPLPYVVVYRVLESTIEILYIWHGARKRQQK